MHPAACTLRRPPLARAPTPGSPHHPATSRRIHTRLHVELLPLLVDAPHQRQVRLALQQQLLLLLRHQVQCLCRMREGREAGGCHWHRHGGCMSGCMRRGAAGRQGQGRRSWHGSRGLRQWCPPCLSAAAHMDGVQPLLAHGRAARGAVHLQAGFIPALQRLHNIDALCRPGGRGSTGEGRAGLVRV